MSIKSLRGLATCCSLALAMSMGAGVAQASDLSSHSAPVDVTQTQPLSQAEPEVTPEEFVQGLNELVEQGKIILISSEEFPSGTSNVYGIVDPDSGNVFMTFATNIPKYNDRIWGAMWGWEPAVTFNQTDQAAIATGGVAAVTAMAAAAAAALSETVVGSVISAGVITFVGTAATVYINQYGHCPAARPTLWVGTISRRVACR